MSVTGFNQRRRELAAQQEAEEAARAELAQQAQEAEALSIVITSGRGKRFDRIAYRRMHY